MADKNKSGDFYNRPEKLGAWEGFSQFLWNGETKQFMGRTSSSWGKFGSEKIEFSTLSLRGKHIEFRWDENACRPSPKIVQSWGLIWKIIQTTVARLSTPNSPQRSNLCKFSVIFTKWQQKGCHFKRVGEWGEESYKYFTQPFRREFQFKALKMYEGKNQPRVSANHNLFSSQTERQPTQRRCTSASHNFTP